jgi:hypothetical protein
MLTSDDDDDDERAADAAISVFWEKWDPVNKRFRYRLVVEGAANYIDFNSRAEDEAACEKIKAKQWAEAVRAWRRLSVASSASSGCRPRRLFNFGGSEPDEEGYKLRDKRQDPNRKMAGGESLRWKKSAPRVAQPTHVSFCVKCGDDDGLVECPRCPRALCCNCCAENASGDFVCEDCAFKDRLQGGLGGLFKKLNVNAQKAGAGDDFIGLIDSAMAALEAQQKELAEVYRQLDDFTEGEVDGAGMSQTGLTAKKRLGLALLERLREGGAPDDAGGPPLSAMQMSKLKTQIVEQIFALGHGKPAQTQLLLEAVFDDRLVRFMAPRFDTVDDGGAARRIVDGLRDFVEARKLGPEGGTYVTATYIELETIALATAASGGGAAVGLPNCLIRRKAELEAGARRGPRNRRKTRLRLCIARDHWHDPEVSRIDSFSKGLVTTPMCTRRSIQLMSNRTSYAHFLKSDALLGERARLAGLGHKGAAKAFSYHTYLAQKCDCIMEPQMRSCVCKICQQVEYYLAAGHDHAQRRHKAQIQTYGKCATDEKIKWIAPPRAITCAALRP